MLNQSTPADAVFFALGDASRRAIVEQLSSGPASVSGLAAPLELTLAAVVQHIQVLERCGLVATEKIGRTRTCRLSAAGLTAGERWFAERRARWEGKLDRLGEVLEGAAPNNKPRSRKR